MRIVAAVVALVALVHGAFWALGDRTVTAADVTEPLASMSYTPYARSQHPDHGDRPTLQQINADLHAISPYTKSIRTYSSTAGVEQVVPAAANYGLKVTVGAWIDKNETRNEAEIRTALDLAKRYRNVDAIVVGNETTLRAEKSVDELIKIIQRVKRQSPVPVTTGEIWNVWLDHPELASAVDFIAAHILPYWEGIPADRTVDQAIQIYDKLRAAFPGKRIVIAEFGWPSAGYNMHAADPGRAIQAKILRDFVSRAEAYGIDYNIIESIDQPWKTNEGGVGPYWGMFDASRIAKFAWTGPIKDPDHWKLAVIAVLAGLLLSLPLLAMRATAAQTALLSSACHVAGMWAAMVFAFYQGHYFVPGAAFALGLGVLLLVPLLIIALGRIDEISAIAFGREPVRLVRRPVPAPAGYAPKVSIHIPAYREPPEMLKATLDAVAALDYPNFECVVVINNTPDPAFWQPVQEHCLALGQRFKFVNVDNMAGFKAGALRLALDHYTAEDAQIIGVIDADYVVQPDWLKDLVPLFADAKVGLVQAPQDHRDGLRSPMHHAMNGEYAGFFDIGMVQRNEANSIIVHGTMCLIRRAAITDAGGWSSDTICEDTDLGLAIVERGWQTHYTNIRYGHGLLPDNYESYQKQRYRWAYGGFQIIKKHWRSLLPGSSAQLTREQKRGYGFGWLSWLGAESLGVVVAGLNLVWVPIVAFAEIAVPDRILTIPILASFAVSLIHFLVLYRLRVSTTAGQMAGSVIAAMSVQWTVARAVATGLVKDHLPFMRTAKGGATRRGADFPAFWEAIFGSLLVLGAAVLVMTNYKQIHEINIFAIVLMVQSLPFFAAVAIAALDGTRLNDFAFWREGVERLGRLVALPGGRQAVTAGEIVMPLPAAAPPSAPSQAENRTDVTS